MTARQESAAGLGKSLRAVRIAGLWLGIIITMASRAVAADQPQKIWVESSLDGSLQPSYLMLPEPLAEPAPLLVSLHTWSFDLEQRNEALEAAALAKGWIYLYPNFRGPNNRPEAGGSALAQQDILDAMDWVAAHYAVDPSRVYLTGNSGGGHMTLLMVGRHPQRWAAASAWVPISDLRSWETTHREGAYGKMVRQICGGAPGDDEAVDRAYDDRSPLTWLGNAKGMPIDISAGIHDGHTGSVPIRHSLAAFNVLAEANGGAVIAEAEIVALSSPDGRLPNPQPSDLVVDVSLNRSTYLRRMAGPARVTIFEGGHEDSVPATISWLDGKSK